MPLCDATLTSPFDFLVANIYAKIYMYIHIYIFFFKLKTCRYEDPACHLLSRCLLPVPSLLCACMSITRYINRFTNLVQKLHSSIRSKILATHFIQDTYLMMNFVSEGSRVIRETYCFWEHFGDIIYC